jgi:hypothetical protein
MSFLIQARTRTMDHTDIIPIIAAGTAPRYLSDLDLEAALVFTAGTRSVVMVSAVTASVDILSAGMADIGEEASVRPRTSASVWVGRGGVK